MSAHHQREKFRKVKLTPEPVAEGRTEVDMLKEARRRSELQRLDEDIARLPADQRGVFNRLRSLIS